MTKLGEASGATMVARTGGVVRRVDELGRIVIPVEIRRKLHIDVHDSLEITTSGRQIVLAKSRDACVLCGSRKELSPFRGHQVCESCREELGDSTR